MCYIPLLTVYRISGMLYSVIFLKGPKHKDTRGRGGPPVGPISQLGQRITLNAPLKCTTLWTLDIFISANLYILATFRKNLNCAGIRLRTK